MPVIKLSRLAKRLTTLPVPHILMGGFLVHAPNGPQVIIPQGSPMTRLDLQGNTAIISTGTTLLVLKGFILLGFIRDLVYHNDPPGPRSGSAVTVRKPRGRGWLALLLLASHILNQQLALLRKLLTTNPSLAAARTCSPYLQPIPWGGPKRRRGRIDLDSCRHGYR